MPQFALSEESDTHLFPHIVCPIGHADVHAAFMQVCPIGQAMPHAPQFSGSLVGSTHVSPASPVHGICGAVHWVPPGLVFVSPPFAQPPAIVSTTTAIDRSAKSGPSGRSLIDVSPNEPLRAARASPSATNYSSAVRVEVT